MQLTILDIDRRAAAWRFYRHAAPEAWDRFCEKVNLSWLHHDYAMDGLALTPEEITRALRGDCPRHQCDAELMAAIRQTLEAIEWTQLHASSPKELSLEDVKLFHAALCEPESPTAGRYRKHEGPMVPYLHTITRTPSISYRLRKLVEAMATTYTRMHPIKAAALIHHEFMCIWPFDMRSGTAGRLLLNHWLLSHGYPPAIIHAFHRQDYYTALGEQPEAMIPLVIEALDSILQCAEARFGASLANQVA